MKKSNVFTKVRPIICSVCGKDLLQDMDNAVVIFTRNTDDKIESVYSCCRNPCDLKCQSMIGKETEWVDLKDYANPQIYFRKIIAIMNAMNRKKLFENEEVFEAYKNILISMYPYVSRDIDREEKMKANIDGSMPVH